jgi:uncharacterized membrane protein YkoI
MIKKSITALLVVVAVLGVALVVYGLPNSKNTTVSTSSNQSTNVLVSNTSNNTTAQNADKVISSVEAKKIASTYIEQAGATAGTPQLVNQDGKKVYVVPVIYKGTNAGEIDIDALTGQNLGGAGGV